MSSIRLVKNLAFGALCALCLASCAAQQLASEFVGTYFVKEGSSEFVLMTVVQQGDRLMAVYSEGPSIHVEMRPASRVEVATFLASLGNPFPATQVSALKGLDGGEERIVLLKVPVGTILDSTVSKTGYFALGVGAVEVHKR